jgi:hypothetical protein
MSGYKPRHCDICDGIGPRTRLGNGWVHAHCTGKAKTLQRQAQAERKQRLQTIHTPYRTQLAPGAPWPYKLNPETEQA